MKFSRTYVQFESNVSFVTMDNMTHWHNTCPSLRTSKKLSGSPDVFNGKPVTLLTHSKHSCANSSLYLLFIYNKKKYIKGYFRGIQQDQQHVLNALNVYDFFHCSHAMCILLIYCLCFIYNSKHRYETKSIKYHDLRLLKTIQ